MSNRKYNLSKRKRKAEENLGNDFFWDMKTGEIKILGQIEENSKED